MATAFLYASQSGNAECIAKMLHHTAVSEHGFSEDPKETICMTLNEAEKAGLLTKETVKTVVFVCSTHGEGDYPDNGQKMKRWLKKAKDVNLAHLRYTVLALGDSNYSIFCGSGRHIDAKLHEFGATRFYPRGEADDGTSLEVVVDPWIAGLWPALLRPTDEQHKVSPELKAARGGTLLVGGEEEFFAVPLTTTRVLILYDVRDCCKTFCLKLYEVFMEAGVEASIVPGHLLKTRSVGEFNRVVLCACDAGIVDELKEFQSTMKRGPPWASGSRFAVFARSDSAVASHKLLGDAEEALLDLDSTMTPLFEKSDEEKAVPENNSQNSTTGRRLGAAAAFADEDEGATSTWSTPGTPTGLPTLSRQKTVQLSSSLSVVVNINDVKLWLTELFHVLVHQDGSERRAYQTKVQEYVQLTCDEGLPAEWKEAHAESGGRMMSIPTARVMASSARPGSVYSLYAATSTDYLQALKPVVFFYCGATRIPKLLAEELAADAASWKIDAIASDVSNYRGVGFPRAATFIFVLGPESRVCAKTFFARVEAFDARAKNRFEQLNFAIIGLTDPGALRKSMMSSERKISSPKLLESYHECALKLEALLLERGGRKMHATGLAKIVGNQEVDNVTVAWCRQLWPRLLPATVGGEAPGTSEVPTTTAVGSSGLATNATPQQQQPPRITSSSLRASYLDSNSLEPSSSSYPSWFPWEGCPVIASEVSQCSTLVVHSGTLAHIIAQSIVERGKEFGVPCEVRDFSHCFPSPLLQVDYVIAVLESNEDMKLPSGKRVMRALKASDQVPDLLTDLQCAVLAVGDAGDTAVHPAVDVIRTVNRLGGKMVFNLGFVSGLGALDSYALPWATGVFGAFTAVAARKKATVGNFIPKPHLSSVPKEKRSVVFFYAGEDQWASEVCYYYRLKANAMGFEGRVAQLSDFQRMKFMSSALTVFVVEGSAWAKQQETTASTELSPFPSPSNTASLPGTPLLKSPLKSPTVTGTANKWATGEAPVNYEGIPANAKKFLRYLHSNRNSGALFDGVKFALLDILPRPAGGPAPLSGSVGSDFGTSTVHPQHHQEPGAARLPPIPTQTGYYLRHLLVGLGASLLVEPCTASVGTLRSTVDNFFSSLVTSVDMMIRAKELQGAGASVASAMASSEGTAGTEVTAPPGRSSSPQSAGPPADALLILYGSQQGNAEAIAQEINERAIDHGYHPTVAPLNGFEEHQWRKRKCVVIVCSTTGEGEFPDNAMEFYRFIKKKTHPMDLLRGMKCAVLALGDTNYSRFCYAGRLIDRRLEELGATRFYARGDADDGLGLEMVVEPWIDQLWGALETTLQSLAQTNATTEAGSSSMAELGQSDSFFQDELLTGKAATFPLSIKHWEVMTAPSVPQQVVLVSFSVSKVSWNPGDALALIPRNDEAEVDKFLQHFDVDSDDPFVPPDAPASKSVYKGSPIYDRISFPIKNRQVLASVTYLRVQNKQLLNVLLSYTTNPADISLLNAWLSPHSEEWKKMLADRICVVDLLQLLSDCRPPFRVVVEYLAPLTPRYYSICSAMSRDPTVLRICFKVIPRGVCTTWLWRLCQAKSRGVDIEIRASLRDNAEFRLPIDTQVPLIMIGPGTGVAPFLAFLQHRAAVLKLSGGGATPSPSQGEAHLFFGCRQREVDYLFKAELEGMDSRVLNDLHVAFSQEATEGLWYGGTYVQDKLLGCSNHLCNLIFNWSAYIFVCGDADSMARDVHHVLEDIVEEYMGWTPEQASNHLRQMMEEGRYQRDIWTA